jgi:tetratricopeptide repeat protein
MSALRPWRQVIATTIATLAITTPSTAQPPDSTDSNPLHRIGTRRQPMLNGKRMRCTPFVVAMMTLATAVASCGSPAVSVHPLYTSTDEKELINEPRIEGDWIVPDLDKAGAEEEVWMRVHVDRRGGGRYSVEVRPVQAGDSKEQEVTRYDLALLTLNDKLFFDGMFDKAQTERRTIGRNGYVGLVPLHLLGRIWVQDDFLRVTIPESSWVIENTQKTFRESISLSTVTDLGLITASTDDLRAFMDRYADQPESSYVLYLCRPDDSCTARAFDDSIARAPDDVTLSTDVAKSYLKLGNYQRAAELTRRLVEREPNSAERRSDLGQALLFQRDFEGARKEFASARRLDPTLMVAKDGLTWSYFLDGKFAEAALASTPTIADERVSVDSILLHYFSLERLGRRAEASAFLSEQTATFKGFREEQVLLVEIQGRVRESMSSLWQYPEGEPQRRLYFYSSLRALTNGDTRIARNRLENLMAGQLLKKPPKDSLIALAATIELDRLVPP